MKPSEFKLKRLDDFAAAMDRELKDNPFKHSPFGMSRDGDTISSWEMCYRRLKLYTSSGGCNLFSRNEFIIITVLPTDSGIKPLASEWQFGWTGKINEFVAEMSLCWAFELISDSEANEFMKEYKPSVNFSYSDSNGPGEITVKYTGEFWVVV